MQREEILVRDLMPGYSAESDGVAIRLVNPEGHRVAWLSRCVASNQDWRDLSEALLMLARTHAIECEILRERVENLERRLGEVEEERDTSDRIAEGLYEFFSRTARRHANRARSSGEE